MSSNQAQSHKNDCLNPEDYKLFLEKIAQFFKVPYFWFFTFITVVFEIARLITDYITIVWKLGLPIEELLGYWTTHWLMFLWPICMVLMYFTITHLRNYTLQSLTKIRSRLVDYPTDTLRMLFSGRSQHLISLVFGIIVVLSAAYSWLTNMTYTFNQTTVLTTEIPEFFTVTSIWIAFNWIIGGYFVWICLSVIFISRKTSSLINDFDLVNHDRAGGFRVIGSLATRTAFLFIFSVSFMFPGFILQPATETTIIGQFYLISTLLGLITIEFSLFFLPLFFFHSEMRQAKTEKLIGLDSLIANFLNGIDEKNTLTQRNLELLSILSLRQAVDSMHEYPFNIEMLIKVIVSAIIPFLLVLLQLAGQFILETGAS